LKYLLDTNVIIALIKATPTPVRERFESEQSKGSTQFVSSIVIFELWYGVFRSARREENAQSLARFLSGPISLLPPFDEADARFAAEVRAEMDSIGRPIGDYDLLIAGQALRHELTLVSANAKEFGRVKNLSWEDWSKP
jgi:tRNA(fMet)-specific endonuclease VapC